MRAGFRKVLLSICALSAAGVGVASASDLKALVGGTLIDGFGGTPLRDSVVIIEGARIKAVGQVGSLSVPAGAAVISTEGMSVMPGLWDMHVHLMINGHADYAHWDETYMSRFEGEIMPASAHQLLLAGVTSARDLGGPLEASIAVRDRVARGEIPGPTLYVSGPFIQKTAYPGTEAFRWGVDDPEDARAKVKRLAEAGVDVIKLIDQDQLSMKELRAIVDEAHKHDLPVIAHSHRPVEIRRGLKAGVDGFEHTGQATAPEYAADIMEKLKERTAAGNPPLFWTPTISILWNYEYMRDNPEMLDDPSWKLGMAEDVVTSTCLWSCSVSVGTSASWGRPVSCPTLIPPGSGPRSRGSAPSSTATAAQAPPRPTSVSRTSTRAASRGSSGRSSRLPGVRSASSTTPSERPGHP